MAFVATFALATGAALTRGRWPDRVVRAASAAGLAMPAFWFGLVLQLVFAASLGWLPSSGRVTPGDGSVIDRVQHLVLPAMVLADRPRRGLDALPARVDGRGIRSAVRRRRRVHAGFRSGESSCDTSLRAALLRWSPWSCSTLRCSCSGAVVTESVFAWPGLGTLFTEALARRDYAVLMAMVMLASGAIVVLNLVADLVYQWLDPRVTP